MRPVTWLVVDEGASGDCGLGGKLLSTEEAASRHSRLALPAQFRLHVTPAAVAWAIAAADPDPTLFVRPGTRAVVENAHFAGISS